MIAAVRRSVVGAALAAALAGAVQADAPAAGAAFSETEEARLTGVTSIGLAPGGDRLYAVALTGTVLRWKVDSETGALSDPQSLVLDYFQTPSGPRGLIGLAFDPEDPLTLWVSDNHPVPRTGAGAEYPDFSGRISRIRIAPGDAFAGEAEAYVTGLPRSCADHVTNSLRFRSNPDADAGGPRHLLYVAQGSNTAKGEADPRWCWRPERLLSGAILEIDPRRTPPAGGFDVTSEPLPPDGGGLRFGYGTVIGNVLWPGDDGELANDAIPIDAGPFAGRYLHFSKTGLATVREGAASDSAVSHAFYDPFAPGAPVRLFATGVRNAYDFVWGADGRLYAPTNGAGGGGRAPDDPGTEANEALRNMGREQDFLHRLARGGYAGHPNPLRGEFVVNGGNPTAEVDANEEKGYPVGVAPDPDYRAAASIGLGYHWSPTGTVLYPGSDCAPALCDAVIFANYSKGNNLRALTFDPDGAVRTDTVLTTAFGLEISHPDPIDLALGPRGRLYLATLERSNGQGRLLRLDPVETARAAGTRLRVVDAADPRAVTFAIEGSAAAARPLALVVDGGRQGIPVEPDDAGRFVVDLGGPGFFEVRLEGGAADAARTLARIGLVAGRAGVLEALDGAAFGATDQARDAGAVMALRPHDLVPHDKDRSSDADKDGLNDGFTGAGYLAFDGPVGIAARAEVHVPVAGPRSVTLRLANGSWSARPLRIETDTGQAGIDNTRTGGWNRWEERTVTLPFAAGVNEIRIVQVGDDAPIVDLVIVSGDD